MRAFLIAILLIFSASSVSGLFCWLCSKGSGSSFEDCNTRKEVQNCSEAKFQEPGKGPLNRCAYFSYYSLKDKKIIYAKSCTFASYCPESGDKFCSNVPGGAKTCQVECCTEDKCNDREQFNNPDDKYWCDWKEINDGYMIRGVSAFVACAVAVFIYVNP